jgi:hypothetical protein
MIGRNRCDDPNEENKVYIVGSDRISTELHNLNEDANTSLSQPMSLDYEFNDPTGSGIPLHAQRSLQLRAKGIPIIFYTTGLHKDYHYVTDEVSKIDFPKMSHITQLVYATGMKVRISITFRRGTTRARGKGKALLAESIRSSFWLLAPGSWLRAQ